MRNKILLLFSAILMFCSNSCIQTENSSSTDGATVEGSSTFMTVNSILVSRCKTCHEFHSKTETELLTEGLCVKSTTPGSVCVVAGQPEQSPLYYWLIGSSGSEGGKNMPLGGAISSGEVEFISEWISSIAP